jgi:hypothetical protein
VLDPGSVDLDDLGTALDDRTPGAIWCLDPATGAVVRHSEDDPPPEGLLRIEPAGSHAGYQDMAQFVAAVHHRRAADLLDRAISGRGAFRRFKDTLGEFPELREQWFRYRDARSRRRAASWLAEQGLVDRAAAERLAAAHPDPLAAVPDVPTAVAADLRILFGERLQQVLVFGSWVHGDGPGEHDLQLLVVLADLTAPWDELRRMDDVLWRHTERAGMAVTALPVSAADLAAPAGALLRRAVTEARVVA